MPRHFIDLADLDTATIRLILDEAARLKRLRRTPQMPKPLDGLVLAMIFDKPSTRTRVSFDVGMRELGGETLMLTGQEMQLRRGESVGDTAKVLSRFVDA
ncbi:MAG: ornithine carbamoyltransferase, partial [Rhizobiales bacterium]|nr:ornithine carbamoyltransferase [Hyphomicrobiales bacterium]